MSYDFEPLIDSATAAELLGIHEKTLQRMARAGRVPGIRVDKFWRFRKTELNGWIETELKFGGYACRLEKKENRL